MYRINKDLYLKHTMKLNNLKNYKIGKKIQMDITQEGDRDGN